MPAKRLITGLLLVLGAATTVVVAPWAAPDRKRPRIVSAVMQDIDRDARADSVRLTYSVRVRHVADRDGRYPFAVVGYRVRSVGVASRKALVLLLVEKTRPDPAARPVIRYRRTRSKPVVDRAGMQAAAQVFRKARGHGRKPKPTITTTTPTTTTPTPTTTTTTDSDRDGYADTRDCAPKDAAVHPGAPDRPDLSFVDSNCDGIDGNEQDAIFVSPLGNDENPGTRNKPKRQAYRAVLAAKAAGKDVYAAAGEYFLRVTLESGVGIYGGYSPGTWQRGRSRVTLLTSIGAGLDGNGATGVLLQHLTIHADPIPGGFDVYGIRLLNRSNVTLQHVIVTAADGRAGSAGPNGVAGAPGGDGGRGGDGNCDSTPRGIFGSRGASPAGRPGGLGGLGGSEGANAGQD